MVSGRPTRPRQQRPRGPGQRTGRGQHDPAVTEVRRTGSPAGRPPGRAAAQGRAHLLGQGPDGARRPSSGRRSARRAGRAAVRPPRSSVRASSGVTTRAVTRPLTTTWATRAASSCSSAAWSSPRPTGSDHAGPRAVPPPLADALAELLGPPALRRTPTRLDALRAARPELGEVGGDLLVGRRPHRRDPADQRAGPLGPLEDERRVALGRGRAPAPTGQVATVADQGALQVEAAEGRLPRVQVVQPGAHVVARMPSVAARLGELGAHLAPQQPVVTGAMRRGAPAARRARASSRSPRTTLTRAPWSSTTTASWRTRAW